MKRTLCILCALLAVLPPLSACQPTPEEDVVVNKGEGTMENIILATAAPAAPLESGAEETPAEFEEPLLREPLGAPERWSEEPVTQQVPLDMLTVIMDAEVIIPEVARASVYTARMVGDDADVRQTYLDALFGGLPESGRIVFVREAEIDFDGRVRNISLPSAQVVSSFAAKGIGRTHPDFYPLFIANHILGGSGLSSRLSMAAREKEGLTYGIDTYLSLLDKAPMLRGGFSATPDNFARVVEIVRRQWAEMGRKGVSEEELAEAKDYLIASYNLRFASIDTISAILVYMQKDNLGLDFLQKRNDYVRQVKLKDVNRVAREYFNPEKMIFVNVGSFEKQGVQ